MQELRDLDDQEKLIVDTLDKIAAEYDHEYWMDCVEDDRYPEELWETLGTRGFLGSNVPEEYGGMGATMAEMATIVRQLTSHGVNLSMLVTSATMAPIPIKHHASEEMKERYLPGIASGENIFAFGITEPEAGTNTFKIQTRVERDGDDYLVNGHKVFMTGAAIADNILLVARSDDDEDDAEFTLLVVPTDADGIEMNSLDLAITEEVDQYSVYFDDVRVPTENRIGEEGRGFEYLFDALNPERIITASKALGIGEFALSRGVQYANDREVWDVPIGSHQSVQHSLARSRVDLEQARLMVWEAIDAFENGRETAGAYSNMGKLVASEAADAAVDAAVQTHGGYGFDRGYGVINVERFARYLRIAPFNNEMILNYVGEKVLGLPRSY